MVADMVSEIGIPITGRANETMRLFLMAIAARSIGQRVKHALRCLPRRPNLERGGVASAFLGVEARGDSGRDVFRACLGGVMNGLMVRVPNERMVLHVVIGKSHSGNGDWIQRYRLLQFDHPEYQSHCVFVLYEISDEQAIVQLVTSGIL